MCVLLLSDTDLLNCQTPLSGPWHWSKAFDPPSNDQNVGIELAAAQLDCTPIVNFILIGERAKSPLGLQPRAVWFCKRCKR
jgi:hypothetical protein